MNVLSRKTSFLRNGVSLLATLATAPMHMVPGECAWGGGEGGGERREWWRGWLRGWSWG